ncbi:hypothetical protein ABFG93_04930 [Pseudalkalibacillus hwajinpoensis]|uniref:hypothetical protein n=1 Tax=Guptibacillus hwajinpoensis TaxID=208199 RepID=UPI00325B7B71
MKALRLVFLFSLLLLVTSCNFLTSSNSSEKVEAEKETVDKLSEPSDQALFQEGTYKWEKDGVILGAVDLTDPLDDSFTFMLQAYDGINVGEISGTAIVEGDTATFTHPENGECKASFGWQEDRMTIDTSEGCQSVAGNNVSFTGIYTLIPIGKQTTSEDSASETSEWREALYIDPKFEQGNLSISNVTAESFQFSFDVSSGDHVGELSGTAQITGNEATFQDKDQPDCTGTFTSTDGVISFEEDSCLYYHGAAVDFNGSYTMTDQPPLASSTKREANSCEASPFHSDLLKFAKQGHLKDPSIFLGLTEEKLKEEKPSMKFEETLYEGIPGFYDETYAYLMANEEVFNLRYDALSEGAAIPYEDMLCQFGEPDEVVLNDMDSEYLHVYYAGDNKLSFVSDKEGGDIKAVELESMEDKLKANPIQD